jgi:hypothetical protein
MKAKYFSRMGFVLSLPKEGTSCMLFLEFIRDYSIQQERKIFFTIKDADEQECFLIRMVNETRETFADAVSYINANRPTGPHPMDTLMGHFKPDAG